MTPTSTDPATAPRRAVPRRATEAGLVLVALMLVAGTVVGIVVGRNGPAPLPGAGGGLPWLRDLPAGHAVQVNPATGRSEQRLAVAQPGEVFELAQRDDLLVVTTGAGAMSVIDVATLTEAGVYQGGPGTVALVGEQSLYAADPGAGAVTRLDPANGEVVGQVWQAGGQPVAAATIDGAGTLWVLRNDGQLHRLAWAEGALADAAPPVRLLGAGPDSRLIAHDAGVTVLAPDVAPGAGVAVRVGTGSDGTINVAGLAGRILPAVRAPLDLVAVSIPDASTVVLVGLAGAIAVDTNPYGCARPGAPLVHLGLVRVPCLGAGLVIALDASGQPAAPEMRFAPGSTPDVSARGDWMFAVANGQWVSVDPSGAYDEWPGLGASPAPRPSPKPRHSSPPGGVPDPPGPPAPPGATVPPSTPDDPDVGVAGPPGPPGSVQVSAAGVVNNGTSLTVPVSVGAAPAKGSPVTGYTVTATTASGAQSVDLAAPGAASVTVACGGQCWNVRVDVAATAHSAAGDSSPATAAYTHPNGFPGGPQNGDAVLQYTTQQVTAPFCEIYPEICTGCAANPVLCCQTYPEACSGQPITVPMPVLVYSAIGPWASFTAGTCQLIVLYSGGSNVAPMNCGTPQTWPLYQSTGITGFYAQACVGSACVTSAAPRSG